MQYCRMKCRPVQRCQAHMALDSASSQEIDFVAQVLVILNHKGYLCCIIGSKVVAILHQQGESHWEGSACSLRSRLVYAASTLTARSIYFCFVFLDLPPFLYCLYS